jgi:hypothetical protein
VGPVQDSAIGVLEAPKEELQAHPEMRDIGHRDDNETVSPEMISERVKNPVRIAQVLKDVSANDDVERAIEQRQLALQVSHHNTSALSRSGGSQPRVALQARHVKAAL